MNWLFCILFIASLILDYFQTKRYMKEGRELNTFIVWFKQLEVYFGFWILAGLAITYFLPSYVIAFLAGNETHCVWRNWRNG